MKKVMTFLYLMLAATLVFAQSESSDFMRSTGKIYVVVAVIVVVFLGIIFFLIRLDRKLTKLEKQIKEND